MVIGVTVTPVTFPEMASFCFWLVVPLAFRVATPLPLAAAFSSAVNGVLAFGAGSTEVGEGLRSRC